MKTEQLNNIDAAITILTDAPEASVDLATYRCDSVFCLAGHLCNSDYFKAKGWHWRSNSPSAGSGDWSTTMSNWHAQFGSQGDPDNCSSSHAAALLFSRRGESLYDKGVSETDTDKAVALNRLYMHRDYLESLP